MSESNLLENLLEETRTIRKSSRLMNKEKDKQIVNEEAEECESSQSSSTVSDDSDSSDSYSEKKPLTKLAKNRYFNTKKSPNESSTRKKIVKRVEAKRNGDEHDCDYEEGRLFQPYQSPVNRMKKMKLMSEKSPKLLNSSYKGTNEITEEVSNVGLQCEKFDNNILNDLKIDSANAVNNGETKPLSHGCIDAKVVDELRNVAQKPIVHVPINEEVVDELRNVAQKPIVHVPINEEEAGCSSYTPRSSKSCCTHNNKYNPEGLPDKIFWNQSTGTRVSKEQEEMNMKKYFASMKPIDVDALVTHADTLKNEEAKTSAKHMITIGLTMNKMIEKVRTMKPKIEAEVPTKRQYANLTFCHSLITPKAPIKLPSGLAVDMTNIITPLNCVGIYSDDLDWLVEKLARSSTKNLSARDKCFALYSSAETSLKYCRIPDIFFTSLTEVIMQGLNLKKYYDEKGLDAENLRILGIIKRTYRNHIWIKRKEMLKKHGTKEVEKASADLIKKFYGQ